MRAQRIFMHPPRPAPDLRAARRERILLLLQRQRVRSQAELRELLAAAGHRVTQATLSRDLRDLGVVKGVDGYEPAPAGAAPAAAGGTLWQAVAGFLLAADVAQNLVVLRTPPGGAQPLALALDRTARAGGELPDVVGTIAGDDNVLVVCRDAGKARALVRRLDRLRRGRSGHARGA